VKVHSGEEEIIAGDGWGTNLGESGLLSKEI
jgi:hypothetical protein